MSWFVYLLLGIMAAYLAAGVPVLRAVERRRWGANRLRLVESCVAWLLANAGALACVVVFNRLFPHFEIAQNGDLADVLVFGLGLLSSLSILMGLCFRGRFGRLEALKATATAMLYFLIMGMTVFELNEVREQRQRYQGAVSARNPMELKQRTLAELSQGIGLDFPDAAGLVWAHSINPFDQPKTASVVVELPCGSLPAFLEQIGARGLCRAPVCHARPAKDAELSFQFCSWGPKKWWHPQKAGRFEVWTGSPGGHPTYVFIDLDDAQKTGLYIVYAAV